MATTTPQEYIGADLDAAVASLQTRSGIARPLRLSLGGCADSIGTDRQGAMRRSAHAHTHPDDAFRGFVCFKSSKLERAVRAGKPTRLLAHEWAHLATWQGHGARWQQLMRALGHPAAAKAYSTRIAERRTRPPATWYWHDKATGEMRTGTYREMQEATR